MTDLIRRKLVKLLAFIVAIPATSVLSCNLDMREAYLAPSHLVIGQPAVSPDGSLIAFSFRHPSYEGRSILGLYRVRENRLELPPQPERLWWSSPSFSPDGKSLALRSYCEAECNEGELGDQVGVLDLTSGQFRRLTSDTYYVRNTVVFAPSGQRILYTSRIRSASPPPGPHVVGGNYVALRQVSVDTMEDEAFFPLPPSRTRFLHLYQPTYISSEQIVFEAISPKMDLDLHGRVTSMSRERFPQIFYSYREGGSVSPLFDKANWRTASLGDLATEALFAFVARVDCRRSSFCYDLHLVQNREISRLTHLESYMAEPSVSADGSTVVFLEDESRHTDWEIWLADVRTGEARKTPIRTLVQARVNLSEEMQ